jgi:predicted MPP superfamily phosphohydrolase
VQSKNLRTPSRGSLIEWLKDVFFLASGDPFITQYNLATPKWPEGYPPLKIIFLSDLHVGSPAMTLRRLDNLVLRVNSQKPDLVLLGGDYLNEEGGINGPYVSPDLIGKHLGNLKPNLPQGVVAVHGNHDAFDKDGVVKAFTENGIMLLENDVMRFSMPGDNPGQFYVAGLADDLTGKIDLRGTFEKMSGPEPVIMLEHNPAAFNGMRNFSDRPALTLCGHTHAGQINFPFRKFMGLPGGAPWKYVLGHRRVEGNDLIVSSGLGTSGLPLRVNCPARIVEVTLRHG